MKTQALLRHASFRTEGVQSVSHLVRNLANSSELVHCTVKCRAGRHGWSIGDSLKADSEIIHRDAIHGYTTIEYIQPSSQTVRKSKNCGRPDGLRNKGLGGVEDHVHCSLGSLFFLQLLRSLREDFARDLHSHSESAKGSVVSVEPLICLLLLKLMGGLCVSVCTDAYGPGSNGCGDGRNGRKRIAGRQSLVVGRDYTSYESNTNTRYVQEHKTPVNRVARPFSYLHLHARNPFSAECGGRA